ncbi:MAG: 2,3-bisphosphoglycerate-independent phosphoglycerate mutase [Deltaproteobacteria bacterium]|nr:2,3-bisphosphoglycerate-independent phosphoglycerate mutase [Deltaproteobacteria bacterium]
MTRKLRPAVLIILDGLGINKETRFNAVALAKTPSLTRLFDEYPNTELDASESQVGLPSGFMGNSEVGHLNIGAGRIVYQDFSLISHAIEDESFFTNPAFVNLLDKLKEKNQSLHLIGLVSDGGVHSHLSHLMALIQLAKKKGIRHVAIHAITDGRDTSPTSGIEFLRKLGTYCRDAGVGKIETIMGRFYAMDRDKRWDRTEKAYLAFVEGKASEHFSDPVAYLEKKYTEEITDEFITPAIAKGYKGLKDGDGIIHFNFRADRARQLTAAITQVSFEHFKRPKFPELSGFVMMTPYDENFGLSTAFEKPKVTNTLGATVSQMGLKQLRLAETEKYAHVTYFFNGGEEKPLPGEKRILIPSPKEVATYDLKPEMSARVVTETLLEELKAGEYALVVVNFANPDMVGHTGNLRAATVAVEVVDECLGRIIHWVETQGAFAIVTSDHGNCEKMIDESGAPLTAHTTLPVPLILVDPARKKELKLQGRGRLCDIAPTILQLWDVPKPAEMTGQSLIVKER